MDAHAAIYLVNAGPRENERRTRTDPVFNRPCQKAQIRCYQVRQLSHQRQATYWEAPSASGSDQMLQMVQCSTAPSDMGFAHRVLCGSQRSSNGFTGFHNIQFQEAIVFLGEHHSSQTCGLFPYRNALVNSPTIPTLRRGFFKLAAPTSKYSKHSISIPVRLVHFFVMSLHIFPTTADHSTVEVSCVSDFPLVNPWPASYKPLCEVVSATFGWL